jgi:hypothetical protein
MVLRAQREISCEDGLRRTIDTRQFATQYWAYAIEFEASIDKKVEISSKLDPKQLVQLSEALQQANEFRKFLVAGYNSCAINKAQFAQYGAKFQTLDSISRQIDTLTSKDTLSDDDSAFLSNLVRQYVSLSQKLMSMPE